MRIPVYGLLGLWVLSTNSLAKGLPAPEFSFWEEEEVIQCKVKCEYTLTMKVPPAKVAAHIAYLGQYLISELKESGSLDVVDEVPLLQKYYVLFNAMQVAGSSAEGDFSRSVIEATDQVVKAFHDRADFFRSLLGRGSITDTTKKLLRVYHELEKRNRSNTAKPAEGDASKTVS